MSAVAHTGRKRAMDSPGAGAVVSSPVWVLVTELRSFRTANIISKLWSPLSGSQLKQFLQQSELLGVGWNSGT